MNESSGTKQTWIRRTLTAVLLVILFAILCRWRALPGLAPAGPDEPMRYRVVEYMYEHPGDLPDGYDEEVRDPNWGFSYVLYPYFSYMVSAGSMLFMSLFDSSPLALMLAARMAEVCYIVIAALFCFLTGQKLFGGAKGFCFAVLIAFLPGFHFLGTYLNCDSLAMLAISVILYAWACAFRDGWTWKACLFLSFGMGLCVLSYYNAYGWILISIFYYFSLLYLDRKGEKDWFQAKKTGVICLITIALGAWFFVRNAMLYNGDFLGFRSSNMFGEMYAIEALKPSVHLSPSEAGWSLGYMFFYRDPGWPYDWISLSVMSFEGSFGVFNIYMNPFVNKIYVFAIGIPLLIGVFCKNRYMGLETAVRREVRREKDRKVIVTEKTVWKKWNREGLLSVSLLMTMIIPVCLFTYYSYCSDLQAQGRYMMPAVFSVMYFVICGCEWLLRRIKFPWESLFYWFVSFGWIFAALFNFFKVIVPAYG